MKVIRYENMSEDVPRLLDELGVPWSPDAFSRRDIHTTNHKHYSHYYNDDQIELVRRLSQYVIQEHGYTFEDRRGTEQ